MLAKVFVILKCAAAMPILMADAVLSFALADFTDEQALGCDRSSTVGVPTIG
jgi:hypothetical protein